jgi:hypothetical protein
MWFLPLGVAGWIFSVAAILWMAGATYWDVRIRQVPSSAWLIAPFFLAVLYREGTVLTAGGPGLLIVLAALVVVLASERRRFAKPFQVFVIVVASAALAALLFSAEGLERAGVLAVILWFLSWETHYLGGADAIMLIVCTLLWPGFLWLIVYLATALVWSLVVRILKGGWLKGHVIPAAAMVLAASVLYLAAQTVCVAAGWLI